MKPVLTRLARSPRALVRGLPLFVAAVVVLPACVSQRDHDAFTAKTDKELEKTRTELAQLHADLDATRQRLDNALRANADSSSDAMSSKARLNDLMGRFEELQHGVDELKRDVGASRTELYSRIDELKRSQTAAAPPPVAVPQDKSAHYAALTAAYGKKDFPTVRALGPEFVNRYPTDERADEALYMTGSADLEDGRPSSALGHYNRLLKLFPRSKALGKTLYDMGDAYLMLHDCGNAKTAFDAVEKRYPKEKLGVDAKTKLGNIAKNPPGLCAPS